MLHFVGHLGPFQRYLFLFILQLGNLLAEGLILALQVIDLLLRSHKVHIHILELFFSALAALGLLLDLLPQRFYLGLIVVQMVLLLVEQLLVDRCIILHLLDGSFLKFDHFRLLKDLELQLLYFMRDIADILAFLAQVVNYLLALFQLNHLALQLAIFFQQLLVFLQKFIKLLPEFVYLHIFLWQE